MQTAIEEQPLPIINGRLVDKSFMSGEEIIREASPAPGRRVVLRRGLDAHTVERSHTYSSTQLLDKKGRHVRIETIPDRTKGCQGGR